MRRRREHTGGQRTKVCNAARLAPPASPSWQQKSPAMRVCRKMLYEKGKLERAKGFEPSTPTLARLCSTPELHPRSAMREASLRGR